MSAPACAGEGVSCRRCVHRRREHFTTRLSKVGLMDQLLVVTMRVAIRPFLLRQPPLVHPSFNLCPIRSGIASTSRHTGQHTRMSQYCELEPKWLWHPESVVPVSEHTHAGQSIKDFVFHVQKRGAVDREYVGCAGDQTRAHTVGPEATSRVRAHATSGNSVQRESPSFGKGTGHHFSGPGSPWTSPTPKVRFPSCPPLTTATFWPIPGGDPTAGPRAAPDRDPV